MVRLGNSDPATSSLMATPAHGTLLPCHGFTTLLPAGVLGRGWHLGPSRTRLLDIDSKESYQPMARWLEDPHVLGRHFLALSLGLLGMTPSLGASFFLSAKLDGA